MERLMVKGSSEIKAGGEEFGAELSQVPAASSLARGQPTDDQLIAKSSAIHFGDCD